MRTVFLFTPDADRSPVRDALEYGPCRVEVHLLVRGEFRCPITTPPRLAVLEPAPGAAVGPLLSALRQHPVVGRVRSLIVLDDQWLPMASRMPCTDFVSRRAPPAEVLARVERLIGADSEPRVAPLQHGALVVDLEGFEARVHGRALALTPQEFALLRYLVLQAGRAQSRDVLLSRVWGQRYAGGTRTVDIHVRRLRAKLGEPLAERLQTVRGVGYKWAE